MKFAKHSEVESNSDCSLYVYKAFVLLNTVGVFIGVTLKNSKVCDLPLKIFSMPEI